VVWNSRSVWVRAPDGPGLTPGFSIAILFFLQLTPGRVAGAEMWVAVPDF
jgi:hypothetical protein